MYGLEESPVETHPRLQFKSLWDVIKLELTLLCHSPAHTECVFEFTLIGIRTDTVMLRQLKLVTMCLLRKYIIRLHIVCYSHSNVNC